MDREDAPGVVGGQAMEIAALLTHDLACEEEPKPGSILRGNRASTRLEEGRERFVGEARPTIADDDLHHAVGLLRGAWASSRDLDFSHALLCDGGVDEERAEHEGERVGINHDRWKSRGNLAGRANCRRKLPGESADNAGEPVLERKLRWDWSVGNGQRFEEQRRERVGLLDQFKSASGVTGGRGVEFEERGSRKQGVAEFVADHGRDR